MSHVTRNPLLSSEVCNQVRLKQVCSATKARWSLERIASIGIILYSEWITKTLSRQCGCKGWSDLLEYDTNKFCHHAVHMSHTMTKPTKWVLSESSLCAQWVSKNQSFFMRTAKTLIRLGGCPGWPESSLGAHSFCWFCHVAAHITCIVQKLDKNNNLKWVLMYYWIYQI